MESYKLCERNGQRTSRTAAASDGGDESARAIARDLSGRTGSRSATCRSVLVFLSSGAVVIYESLGTIEDPKRAVQCSA